MVNCSAFCVAIGHDNEVYMLTWLPGVIGPQVRRREVPSRLA